MNGIRHAAALCILWLVPAALSAFASQATTASKKASPQKNPANAALQALLVQAQAAEEKKDYAAAADAYEQYLAQKPDDAAIHFQLGYAYSALARTENAANEYRKAIELNPKMGEAYQNLGLTVLEKSPAEAIEPLRKAAELLPAQSQPKYLLGWALERTGQLAPAIEQYQAAEKLDPKSFDTHFALGRALLGLNRAAEADPEFREALRLRPDSSQARLGLGQSLIAQKKTEEAAAALGAYVQGQPQDAQTRVQRASLLLDLGKNDEAIVELDRAAANAPESAAALKLRSEIYLQQHKWSDAAQALQKAVAAAPQDAEAHAALGHAWLQEKNYPGAARELAQALHLSPQLTDALRDLVAAEYLGGNYPAALQALDLLAKRETPAAGSWFIRATCYDKLGRKPEAVEAYHKFLDLNAGKTNDEYFEAAARARLLEREIKEHKK